MEGSLEKFWNDALADCITKNLHWKFINVELGHSQCLMCRICSINEAMIYLVILLAGFSSLFSVYFLIFFSLLCNVSHNLFVLLRM